MENKYKFWLSVFLLSLCFLVVTLFFLIFSTYAAGLKPAISLRDRYVSVVFNIRKAIGYHEADFCWYFRNPISPLRKNDDGTYNYALMGKLVAIDANSSTISLLCSDDKTYSLFLPLEKTEFDGWVTTKVGVNTKSPKPKGSPFMFNTQDIKASVDFDRYFKEDQLYMAIWVDKRSPHEINRQAKSNPKKTINTAENFVVSLLRY